MNNNQQNQIKITTGGAVDLRNTSFKTTEDGMIVGDAERERAVIASMTSFCCALCEYPVLMSFRFCPHCGFALMQMKPIK